MAPQVALEPQRTMEEPSSSTLVPTTTTALDDMPKIASPQNIRGFFLHDDAKFSKLKTKEDPYHVHKTLGMLALCSFFYRYFYVYPTTGTLGFDGPESQNAWLDWATMFVHTLLAFSSMLFRVPKKRIPAKPMVIYEEYRQHAMVFTARCFTVFSLAYLFPSSPCYVIPVAVMAHHLVADRITSIWGTENNTAVRANAARVNHSTFYRNVAKLYSLYQFLAIASHILPNARLAELGYNAVIAIQSSAFMMTLYRKRIIRGRTHMAVYSFCLVLSAFHIVRLIGFSATLMTIVAFLVRINLPRNLSNKYVVWATFLLVALNWEDCLVYFIGDATSSSTKLFSSFVSRPLVEMPIVQGSGLAMLLHVAFWGERAIAKKTA